MRKDNNYSMDTGNMVDMSKGLREGRTIGEAVTLTPAVRRSYWG